MRLTLKAKLGATFAIVVALAAGGMYLGISNLGQMNDTYDELIDNKIKRVRLATEIDAESVRVARDERNFILAASNAEMDEFAADIEESKTKIDELLAQMYQLAGAEGRAAIDAFKEPWAKFLESDLKVQEQARLQSIRIARRMMQNEGRDAYLAVLESVESLARQLSDEASIGGRETGAEQYQAVTDLVPALLRVRVNLLNVLASNDNPEAQQRFAKVVEARIAELQAQVDKASRLLGREHRASFDAIETGIAEWLPLLEGAMAKGLENGDYYASEVAAEGGNYRRASDAILDEMTNRLRDEVNQAQADASATYETSRTTIIGALIAIVLIAAIAAIWIVLSITRAVGSALGFANAVAAGDLNATAQVKSNDEIKDLIDALNAMAAKLREVVGEVSGAVRNVASGSQEMAAASEQLSQGATEQAASAEEASSSMEQMT
ncbi:HAMP domain-containing methyl-accepting chemotaxis protein, partial [Litchfieldella qijiaojingensis]|uniref:HAMP domain-containing methyl-accepting chemotaxis protein n=1 Tax=Litchfieldella qijiaojingensis TaxID=980347 RepID=UPI00167C3EFA